jgi:SAM-dependent methyltransferase
VHDRHLFIDEDVAIKTDSDAELALAALNDIGYVEDGAGIKRVPRERWAMAQHAERKHWMVLGLDADDDHNYGNASGFEGYLALAGLKFSHAIELGCGPFTNLRIIGDACCIQVCDLLDPLIMDYLLHPGCRYSDTALSVERTSMSTRLRRFFRRSRILPLVRLAESGTIPIGRLIPSPVEDMPLGQRYDLVVMENVIEHCFDVERAFNNIVAILRPGGMLVLHDRYYCGARVQESSRRVFDAAHPLRVDRSIVDAFLSSNFTPEFSRVEHISGDFMGVDVGADHFYFIGRRRALDTSSEG